MAQPHDLSKPQYYTLEQLGEVIADWNAKGAKADLKEKLVPTPIEVAGVVNDVVRIGTGERFGDKPNSLGHAVVYDNDNKNTSFAAFVHKDKLYVVGGDHDGAGQFRITQGGTHSKRVRNLTDERPLESSRRDNFAKPFPMPSSIEEWSPDRINMLVSVIDAAAKSQAKEPPQLPPAMIGGLGSSKPSNITR